MEEELDFDDPETVMREARARFIEAFPGRVRSISMLFNAMNSTAGAGASQAAVRRMTHQMAGIAGTLGFPSVSEKASDLEQLAIATSTGQMGVGAEDIARALARLTDSFASDMRKPQPDWAEPSARAAGPRVLIVDPDDAQRQLIASFLRAAGFQPETTSDERDGFTRARLSRPALIFVNAALPGDGAQVLSRQIKASPELAGTPVVFVGAGTSSAGRALGPDQFLPVPFDQGTLVACVTSLTRSRPGAADDGLLTYEALAFVAQEVLRHDSLSLTLVRLPADELDAASIPAATMGDFVARFGPGHLVTLTVGKTPHVLAGARSLEALLAAADEPAEN